MLFAAYGSTLLSNYLWLGVVQRVTASTVTPFMLLLPIFSVILSYLFMGEIPTGLQILAGSVILLGVMVSQNLHLRAYHFLAHALLSKTRRYVIKEN
ncbi:DMT family transporter [Candidatus Bealeia paramacronuclearis]|uniref:DMT family transporter n=1 Tax=Candidatus Bealeia paramacronuclearis TaxID=1921001 RepID=UPI0030CDCB65